jgi:3'-5' exoribonuclease
VKDFFIADAPRFENQPITSFFVIASITARDKKGSAGQYLALTLADKSGQFEARMWEDFADALTTCAAGCYVKVQGQVTKYQGKFQITLTKMRLAAASEIDTADFVPTTQYDIPTMAAELRGYVQAFSNPHLRRLVLSFLDDPTLGPAFLEAPAAKRLHHAWIGGLLEHVLHLVRVCRATAPFYPEVDPDLLVTGAILHDIGKVRELSWANSSATSPSPSASSRKKSPSSTLKPPPNPNYLPPRRPWKPCPSSPQAKHPRPNSRRPSRTPPRRRFHPTSAC